MKSTFLFALFFTATISAFSQNVDYATQIQPIFNQRCTSCHGGTAGLFLTSYENVTNAGIVVAGNANASKLYDKVRLDKLPAVGSRMPQGGALSQSQVDLIRDWINQGATATNNEETIVANRFVLKGNYPNPFNPGTTISFESPESGSAQLEVFSITGQKVLTRSLRIGAGEGSVYLAMDNFPSGMYLYRVNLTFASGAQYSVTRSMALVK